MDYFKKIYASFLDLSYTLALIIINFYAPVGLIFLVLILSQFIDTAFGYVRSSKIKKASSKKLRVGFTQKFFGYFSLLALLYIIDVVFLNPLILWGFPNGIEFLITKAAGCLLVFTELKSINENYSLISGKSLGKSLKDLFGFGAFIAKGISDVKNGNFDDYKQKEYDTTSESESESEAERNDIESVSNREFTDIER